MVANDRRGETTLGTEAESLQRNIPAGFHNTPMQQVDRFKLRPLCRDQPENDKLVLGHVFEWLKGAGARIIVF